MQHSTEKTFKSTIFASSIFTIMLLAFTGLAFTSINNNYNLISSVPVNAEFLTTDFLKSAYVISDQNRVMKYDSTGSLIGVFNENKFGRLTSVDATSPFNVLLFYRDFATIVTTDMRLTSKHYYKLPTIGINNPTLACLSHDNYIWVYDQDANQLKKVTDQYEIIYESPDVAQLLNTEVVPNYLVEKDGLIYMSVPKMGVIMFDIYGNFYTVASFSDLGILTLDSFQIVDGKIVFFHDGMLNIYQVGSRDLSKIRIPKTIGIRSVKVEKGYLYLLNEEELQFYALNK